MVIVWFSLSHGSGAKISRKGEEVMAQPGKFYKVIKE